MYIYMYSRANMSSEKSDARSRSITDDSLPEDANLEEFRAQRFR